jgi:hypothetical protein
MNVKIMISEHVTHRRKSWIKYISFK